MLSVTSKYALRALTHLAALPEGESILGKDLSKKADIPANYLSKILWMMGSAGLIDGTRGSRGGYRLRRKADAILLFEVIGLFDRTRIAPTCFLGEDRVCSDEDACSAHVLWRDVRNVYTHFLQSTTLADIARAGLPVGKRIEASKTKSARRRPAVRGSRP